MKQLLQCIAQVVLLSLRPTSALVLKRDARLHAVRSARLAQPCRRSSVSFASPPASTSPESIRNEINEMKIQAQERFRKLAIQMEELKEQKRMEPVNRPDASIADRITTNINSANKVLSTYETTRDHSPGKHSLDSMEGDITKQMDDLQDVENDLRTLRDLNKLSSSAPRSASTGADLLDDTRWKIVFNIGRESGTWMPPSWGLSGDRILFQVEFDFTGKPLYGDTDDFFQGIAGIKQLNVVNAFLIPRGVGSHSVGRRPVQCKPFGGYKVCRGQGPMGTDLVRLYIELTDDINMPDHESDVYCPRGRIYATCGYFVMHDSRESDNHKSAKQIAQLAHRNAVLHQQLLQHQIDADSRLFSVERLKLMRELYVARMHVDEAAKHVHVARQREPERSQLRLSKMGDVGLSKDGGVCCKVHKGMALEYHILGRMEIGCVDDHKYAIPCSNDVLADREAKL